MQYCVNVAADIAWMHLMVANWRNLWGAVVAASFCTGSTTATLLHSSCSCIRSLTNRLTQQALLVNAVCKANVLPFSALDHVWNHSPKIDNLACTHTDWVPAYQLCYKLI